ncbi:MAG: energy transducer TonB [Candidatus Acidiferrales bacterium]
MLNQNVFFLEDAPHGLKPKVSIVLPPTEVATKQDLFAEAMLEGSSTLQKRHPLKWVASLGAHLAVLFILLLLPLYYSQGLNLQKMSMTILVAPPPPFAAPPPPPMAAAPKPVRTIPKTFTPGKLTAPSFVPKAVASTPDAAPPTEAISGMTGGVPGGIPGGQMSGILGGTMTGAPTAPAAPAVVAEKPKSPVRVGGDVKPPRLLWGPEPVYPILARQSMVQGVVMIEAIIDEHGNVVQEKLIGGHPLLVPAAMKAVSQRKYAATILDGVPTPVTLRVEITFHMG